jgi:hypothetical protein
MYRTRLLSSLLALAFVASAPFAIAQDAPDNAPNPAQAAAGPGATGPGHRMDMSRAHRGDREHGDREHGRRGHGMDRLGLRGPHSGAAADLHALERLYRDAGRSRELPALYNDVLAKTQDPMLRTYVYHRLARLQMQPANVDQAAATLRKSLEENLANEGKRRAEGQRC